MAIRAPDGANKILSITLKEEGRNLEIFDHLTNIIWNLYTFISTVINHSGTKTFKFLLNV